METEADVAAGIAAACGTIQTCQRFSRGCARTWCVTAIRAMKSVTATSNSSSELIENNSITINTHNSKPIRLYEKEMNNYKSADLRSQRSPVATFSASVLPSTSIPRRHCRTHDPCFKVLPFKPPATHERLQKLFSYTLYIFCFMT